MSWCEVAIFIIYNRLRTEPQINVFHHRSKRTIYRNSSLIIAQWGKVIDIFCPDDILDSGIHSTLLNDVDSQLDSMFLFHHREGQCFLFRFLSLLLCPFFKNIYFPIVIIRYYYQGCNNTCSPWNCLSKSHSGKTQTQVQKNSCFPTAMEQKKKKKQKKTQDEVEHTVTDYSLWQVQMISKDLPASF